MTNFVLTETHIIRAYNMGRVHATAEIELGNSKPTDNILDEEDVRQIAWEITTVKLDPASEEANSLASAYTDGYLDVWEEQ